MNGESKLRVLVVEDESLVAMMVEDVLIDLGHEIAGVAGRLSEALRLATDLEIDFAVLDLNLNGERTDPVAAALRSRGVPFVFPTFNNMTSALREYAIGGVLHFDHLASLRRSPANIGMLGLATFQLSRACGIAEAEARVRMDRLLARHEIEWKGFVQSLGPTSFVADWAVHAR